MGVGSGMQLVHLHPQGGERKFYRRNLQGKFVSAPRGRAGVNFFRTVFCCVGDIWRVGVVHLVVLGSVSRATTKKRLSTF